MMIYRKAPEDMRQVGTGSARAEVLDPSRGIDSGIEPWPSRPP